MYQVDDLLRFAHHNYDIHCVAPNIELMFKNSMFDSITSSEPTYLAHVTTSLDKILDSGLFPSPGCLVGAVYCVPAVMEKKTNVLRMHNLGAFYYLEEFPSSNSGKDIGILIIKVNKPENYSPILSGVNYLRLGDVHYNTYEKIKHSKANGMKSVAKDAVNRINDSKEFLTKSVSEYVNTATENPKKFLVECEAASKNLPILSYLYFEAIYGFIMLHASDQYSLDLKSKGEMNSYYAKSFLFNLFPGLRSGKFRLSDTRPDIDELEYNINALDYISEGSKNFSLKIIAESILKNMCNNFFNTNKNITLSSSNFSNDISHIAKSMRPLLGHLIHRILRHSQKELYKNVYRRFENNKADAIWTFWERGSILFPFNALYPKGEIGFTHITNEAASCEFYKPCELHVADKTVTFKLGEKLNNIHVHQELADSGTFNRRDGSIIK